MLPSKQSQDAALPFLESRCGILPDILDYKGEFGPELVLFLPFCIWLGKLGLLNTRKIQTYRGMRCFYNDIDCLEILEKDEQRVYVKPKNRPTWLPIKNEHDFDGITLLPLMHIYPDLRAKFKHLIVIPEIDTPNKSLLVIHNKFNDEWGQGPANYISLQVLEFLFNSLKRQFTIIYIRHGMGRKQQGFSEDHNFVIDFDESALLKKHSDVLCFDELFESHLGRGGSHDINAFKCSIYSRCFHFISSQGGGCHQIALFSGSIIAIMHRKGSEDKWAYSNGYYNFMSNVPPIRAICRHDDDLIDAAALFNNTTVLDDRIFIDSCNADLLSRYSPWNISNR